MHHQVLMGVLDGAAQGLEELEALLYGLPLAIAEDVDGHALDMFHDDVRQAFTGGAAVEQSGDRGM